MAPGGPTVTVMVAPGWVRVTVAVAGPELRRLVAPAAVVRRLVGVVGVVRAVVVGGAVLVVDAVTVVGTVLVVGAVAVVGRVGAVAVVGALVGTAVLAGRPVVAAGAAAGEPGFDDEAAAVQPDSTTPQVTATIHHPRNVVVDRCLISPNPNGPVMRRRCGTAPHPPDSAQPVFWPWIAPIDPAPAGRPIRPEEYRWW